MRKTEQPLGLMASKGKAPKLGGGRGMGGEGGPSGLNDWSNTLSLLYIRAWMQASAVTVWMEAFNAPSGTQQQQQQTLPLACETRFAALKKKEKKTHASVFSNVQTNPLLC